jgi:cereblon
MQTGSGSLLSGMGGNGTKSYQCLLCSSVVSYSDRLITVFDTKRHSFINPAGVSCELLTFSCCPGAILFGEPTEEHSWFPGYSWSLALCGHCNSHLGWYYRAVSEPADLSEFWGILVSNIGVR